MDLLLNFGCVALGIAIGIALVVLRTAQDGERTDAERTSEGIEL